MRTPRSTAPRFLTLWNIRFPIGAVASIGHRVSGVLLLLALPALAWALERSLRTPQGYAEVLDLLRSPWALPVWVLAAWALGHHLAAGIRHLLMDVGIGSSLPRARASARAAIVAGIAAALLALLGWLA
jgi:succinate dehydrogenase / fumarate reductase cytochrome b subunit